MIILESEGSGLPLFLKLEWESITLVFVLLCMLYTDLLLVMSVASIKLL